MMTPRQARVALASFLMVAAGVAINALFLQPGPTVANTEARERAATRGGGDNARKSAEPPRAARQPGRSSEERALRFARLKPDSAKVDAIPEIPEQDPDPETIRAVQRELKQRGYGPLSSDAVNGVLGPPTRAAIMAYEHDQGLALTGEASEGLLKRLLLGASAAADPEAVGKVQSVHAERLIRSVQQSLAALGYQLRHVDGRIGEDTRRAIGEFEVDKGLLPKGRISAELLARLDEAAAPRKMPAGR